MRQSITTKPYKIALIGVDCVGKTSIANVYIHNIFDEKYTHTIGCDFFSKNVSVDGTYIDLQIWDTAGQERYKSLVNMYCRGADFLIAVYSADNDDSFESMEEYLRDAIEATEKCNIYIVCNKIDKIENVDPINKGKSFADENKYTFFKTSAKTKEGIKELFEDIAKNAVKTININDIDTPNIELYKKHKKKKCC